MGNRIITEDIESIWSEIDLSPLAGKSVLITGASGVIGTYMTYSLLRWNMFSMDKIGVSLLIHRELPDYLKELEQNPAISIYRGDLSDCQFFETLPTFDCIIHAAGYGQPSLLMENPIKTIRIKTMATDFLLSHLASSGRFLFISTSEVYSGSLDMPYTESSVGTTMPDHMRSCYIEGSRCGEAICHAYMGADKIIRIGRVSLLYGPGGRKTDRRIFYEFIRKALGGSIQMMDAGRGKRVCCYISDTVSILWNILLRGKEHTYNVGGVSHTTIAELARMIGKKLKAPVICPKEEQGLTGAPRDVVPDVSRAISEFGKKDFVSLNDGLDRTISWYRENLS
jgi:Nucleoside-diphosphate-sugar epimerases